MELSHDGLILLEQFESLRLRAYDDGMGTITIGWGHTINVHPGQEITRDQALRFLNNDVRSAVGNVITFALGIDLNQNQFDALVSFEYNTGGLEKSTLLVKLKANDVCGAAIEFSRWIYAGGAISVGLINRRLVEAQLFIKDYYSQ